MSDTKSNEELNRLLAASEQGRLRAEAALAASVSKLQHALEVGRMEYSKSEERYRNLFETMRQGYIENELIRDADGRAVDFLTLVANPQFERLTGYPTADAVGRTAREIVGDLNPVWLETYDRVVRTGEPERFEREEPAFGRWFEVQAYPLAGDRFAILYDDITERRRAELALRESEERQAFLLELSDALRPLADVEAIRSAACGRLGKHLGASRVYYVDYDPAAGVGRVGNDYRLPGLPSLAGEYPFEPFKWTYERISNGVTWVVPDVGTDTELPAAERDFFQAQGVASWINVPLAKDGVLEAALCVVQAEPRQWTADQTILAEGVAERLWAAIQRGHADDARRESEAQTRELAAIDRSEAQFRVLVRGVTDYAIYMISLDGLVSSWNLGAQRIKGYAPEEIIGRHFSTFYSEEDRATGLPQRGLDTARREGRFETEGWRVRKDGTRFLAHVVIDAIRDDDGEVIGFAKITRDVTEREEAQRTLEKTREALSQAQKMEAVGRLTGGIAHDFNNLLMAVMGSLELAQKRLPDDPQLIRLIRNAAEGARRGATLTQRMLMFARRREISREVVDVAALVHGMEELLIRALGPDIRLSIDLPQRLPTVESDPAQLESALMNLVVNARDAMPGGGRITVSARPERQASAVSDLPAGDYVRLTVADEGQGMDADTLARATEPFFTTKGLGKGTGLGLATIHGFAAQLGGVLRLTSQVGVGTEVEIWCPVSVRAAQAASSDAPPSPQPDQRVLTILAVDDDELVLLNTVAMLEDLGHTVISAGDGIEALQALEGANSVDVVITDHAMPRMNGAELAQRILSERPGVPVILASGFDQLPSGDDQELLRLAKPFTQDQLAQSVAQAIQRSATPS